MKRSLWMVPGALFLLGVAYAAAQQGGLVVVNITNLADGTYMLTKSGETASIVPLTVIQPTTGTPPANPTGLTQISETQARNIDDPSIAQELVVTLSAAEFVHSQDPYADLAEAQKAWQDARTAVLTTPQLQQRWEPWENACNAELARLIQNPGRAGGIQTADDYVEAIGQIRDGLKNYLSTLAAAPNIDPGRIIELLRAFMEAWEDKRIDFGELLRMILIFFRGGAMGEVMP